MPTLLPKTIGTLTAFKDTHHQLDIQTIPAFTNRTKRTTEFTVDIQKLNDEDNYQQQQQQQSAGPLPCEPQIPDMSPWEAAERANLGVIRHYLNSTTTCKERTVLVNSQDPVTGATLLHLVISHASTVTGPQKALTAVDTDIAQRLELVSLLLENGADPATCNLYNVQAIHMVPLHIPTNALPFLTALLDHDADINARDGDGWTPLHYAARFCQSPTLVMQALVARGANVNAMDYTSNKSCLFGLIANGDHVDCFQWMVRTAKAKVQLRGQFSFFPSTSATDGNDNNFIPTARMTVTNRAQQQPYADIIKQATLVLQAFKYGRLEILRYLIHTSKTMKKLRSLISVEEIEQTQHVINQHLTGKQHNHSRQMTEELQYLSFILENDPGSLVAKQTRNLVTKISSTSTTAQRPQQQRRKLTRRIQKFFMKPKQLIQW